MYLYGYTCNSRCGLVSFFRPAGGGRGYFLFSGNNTVDAYGKGWVREDSLRGSYSNSLISLNCDQRLLIKYEIQRIPLNLIYLCFFLFVWVFVCMYCAHAHVCACVSLCVCIVCVCELSLKCVSVKECYIAILMYESNSLQRVWKKKGKEKKTF